MIHELKTHPPYFASILIGKKNFELRLNDRIYEEGDELLLKEYIPKDMEAYGEEGYTGRILHREISHILSDTSYGLKEGYVILALKKI